VNRFWSRYIKPILDTVAPRHIVEIGADRGWNTRHLLHHCREQGSRLTVVDPAPSSDFADILTEYKGEFTYIKRKSIDAIPLIAAPDVVLLDGDHNWFTVHSEFQLLFNAATSPPIVLMHDVAWPYARRDMYYDPDSLNDDQRHPFAYRGIEPGNEDLVEDGMNAMLANALHENGAKNGVLTAVEDFIAETSADIQLHVLPLHNGLGIVIPPGRRTSQLDALIASFTEAPALLQAVIELEKAHMTSRAQIATWQARLTRRTDALVRARQLLAERAQRIADLEAKLRSRDDALYSPQDMSAE
jgi:hypothetical protein